MGQEILGYALPRAVIVLIAWGTTCLVMHFCTTVAPLIFYIAGGVWALVGLIAFGYLHSLRREDNSLRLQAIAEAQQPAE
jgi:ferredoxin